MTAIDRIIKYLDDFNFDELSEETKQWILSLEEK